jgi:hypothetical protein
LALTNEIILHGADNNLFGKGPSKEEMLREGNKLLAMKMVATTRNMNLAMYKLSRLIEKEDNLHKVIETGNPGKHLVIETMAEIPFHLKLECTDKTVSPITLTIEDLKIGKVQDLQVFFSFTNKEPSAQNCDMMSLN